MRCGLCGFLIIKPQTALHHVVWCSTMHCYLRCDYAILRAVLVRFVWFMRFGEHPYFYAYLLGILLFQCPIIFFLYHIGLN